MDVELKEETVENPFTDGLTLYSDREDRTRMRTMPLTLRFSINHLAKITRN